MKRTAATLPSPSPSSSRREEAQNLTGWRWIRLGDYVAKIGSGFTPLGGHRVYQSSGTPLIRSQNVHMNRFEPDGLAFITDEQSAKMDSSQVLAGDVLLNITGASIGRVCVAPAEYCPANVNQHVCIIRSNGSLDSEFLSLYFASHEFQKFILSSQAGATRQALTKAMIENFRVPFTELNEQRRLAVQLREQMAEVERARAAVQAQLDAAQSLPAALLRDIFASAVARRWPRQPFSELVLNCDGRRVPLKHSDRANRQGAYPYYGASGIIDRIDDYLFDGEFLLIGEDGANLLARSTPIAFRASGKFWVNNHAHIVQPKPGIRIEFLEHYFAALDLTRYVTGSAQPKLSQGILNEIPFPVPPLDQQQVLVTRLESELAASTQLCQSLETRLAEIELLPAALLRQAFNGQS
jgi:type I restriction enzyme S subunit